jgi:dephospho-CoA kinase
MTALRIGITGPIGCGKSTVSGWLSEAGATIVDADQVAREVLEPGTPELALVAAAFGRHLVGNDGQLDRAALAAVVFRDPEALGRLERIVHPAVRPRILQAFERADASAAPAIVVEAIKLVEGGLAALCDEVWLVRCEPAEQRERLRSRGAAASDIEARIAAQEDLESRLRGAATRVIDTSGPATETRARVLEAWRDALEKHEARSLEGPRSSR